MSANKVRKKLRYPFTIGASAVTWNLPPNVDLSASNNILFRQEFTAFTGSGNTLDTALQCTRNGGTTYDTRAAMPQQTTAVSSGRSYCEETIYQGPPISGTEEVRIPSGSNGGTAVAAGTVVHGPFPHRSQSTGTDNLGVSTWRVVGTPGGNPAATGWWTIEYDSYE